MDESNATCNKRFAKAGLPETGEARRTYRELIVSCTVRERLEQLDTGGLPQSKIVSSNL